MPQKDRQVLDVLEREEVERFSSHKTWSVGPPYALVDRMWPVACFSPPWSGRGEAVTATHWWEGVVL